MLVSPGLIFILYIYRQGNDLGKENDPWNVERFLEDLLLVVKGQSNLDIDGYL